MPLIENIIRPEIRELAAYHVPDSTGFVMYAMSAKFAGLAFVRCVRGFSGN